MTSHGVLKNDYPFHYERLLELHHDMTTGQFPLIRQFYGSVQGNAVMALYPWLTMLPLALLTFIFHSYVMVLRVSSFVLVVSWLASAYFSSLSYFKNKRRAVYFAITYACSLEAVIFEQGDFGTALALVFVPIVFFGFLHLRDKNRWKMLTVGMTGLIYSHIVTSLLMIIFLAVLFVFNMRAFKYRIKSLLQAVITTVVATSLFWLPFVWLLSANKIVSPYTPFEFTHYGLDLFPFLIIIALPMVIVTRLLNRWNYFDKQLLFISIICGALMVSMVGDNVVKWLPFLKYIQFSDRFMPVASVSISYLVTIHVCDNSTLSIFKLSKVALWCGLLLTPLIVSFRSGLAVNSHNTSRLYIADKSFKQYQYGMPLTWAYDYAPKKASNMLHQMSYRDVDIMPKGTKITLKTNQKATIIPITVYNRFNYQFALDGKNVKSSQIDWKSTRKYGLLTLNNLIKGHHLVQIKSIKAEI